MSEPHKVVETKDFSKKDINDLTAQDVYDILVEMGISHRYEFKPYELFAIGWAQGAVHDQIHFVKKVFKEGS
jgi:hypothetical protein